VRNWTSGKSFIIPRRKRKGKKKKRVQEAFVRIPNRCALGGKERIVATSCALAASFTGKEGEEFNERGPPPRAFSEVKGWPEDRTAHFPGRKKRRIVSPELSSGREEKERIGGTRDTVP